jgi:glycosyltransferase involved in cell wall biosynthesis
VAPRKTLLHLIDTGGPGGAETIFLNVVTGLDAQRWRSVAVVPVRDWLWHALQEHGVEPLLLPTRGSFDWRYLSAIARLSRQQRVDLVQSHLLTTAVYANLAARPWQLPVVSTFHGQNDVVASGSYRAAKFRILRRRRSTCVFVSESLRRWFVSHQGIDRGQARVIHNGIDCQQFRPGREPAVRGELGASSEDVLIGAVGNLRVPKDYPTFIRAAALLAPRSARYRFVIVGAMDASIRAELERMRRELNLEDRVMLAGFRNDIEKVLNALDIYALSSSSEGFSLTTVQAMASGLPVVATRCGGPEETVVHGETGLLVPPRAPEALADAVHELSHDEPRRRAFARAGRARAVQHFSIAGMVNAYAALYDACLAGSSASVTAPAAEQHLVAGSGQ